jgi:hypothetical protein
MAACATIGASRGLRNIWMSKVAMAPTTALDVTIQAQILDQPTLGLPLPYPLPLHLPRCSKEEPEMREVIPGHHVACHLREVQPTVIAQAAAAPV